AYGAGLCASSGPDDNVRGQTHGLKSSSALLMCEAKSPHTVCSAVAVRRARRGAQANAASQKFVSKATKGSWMASRNRGAAAVAEAPLLSAHVATFARSDSSMIPAISQFNTPSGLTSNRQQTNCWH